VVSSPEKLVLRKTEEGGAMACVGSVTACVDEPPPLNCVTALPSRRALGFRPRAWPHRTVTTPRFVGRSTAGADSGGVVAPADDAGTVADGRVASSRSRRVTGSSTGALAWPLHAELVPLWGKA